MSANALSILGISAPTFAISTNDLDYLSYRDAQAYARTLEDTGFRMVWLPEVLGREAFTAAQLFLSATTEIIIASGVARALERVPKSTAAAQLTLSDGFPNRYLLGLGVSGAARERGVEPVPFMQGYLNELDTHTARLRGEPGRLPRVIGGYSPGLTRVAATMADGLATVLVTPEHTENTRRALGAAPHLTVIQWVSLERDPGRARALAQDRLAYYLKLPHQLAKFRGLGFDDNDLMPPGSNHLIDSCVYWGEPDKIQEALSSHIAAGADQIAVSLLGDPSPDKLSDYRVLADLLKDASPGRELTIAPPKPNANLGTRPNQQELSQHASEI